MGLLNDEKSNSFHRLVLFDVICNYYFPSNNPSIDTDVLYNNPIDVIVTSLPLLSRAMNNIVHSNCSKLTLSLYRKYSMYIGHYEFDSTCKTIFKV